LVDDGNVIRHGDLPVRRLRLPFVETGERDQAALPATPGIPISRVGPHRLDARIDGVAHGLALRPMWNQPPTQMRAFTLPIDLAHHANDRHWIRRRNIVSSAEQSLRTKARRPAATLDFHRALDR